MKKLYKQVFCFVLLAILGLFIISLLINYRIPIGRNKLFTEKPSFANSSLKVNMIPFSEFTKQLYINGYSALERAISKVALFTGLGFIGSSIIYVAEVKSKVPYIISSILFIILFELANALLNWKAIIYIDNLIYYTLGFILGYFLQKASTGILDKLKGFRIKFEKNS